MKAIHSIFLFSIVATGCSSAAPLTNEAQRQSELDKIAKHCKVPRSILRLTGDELTLGGQEMKDVAFDRVQCTLKHIKDLSFPVKIGFLGNEAYQ
ncbi:hypothetical protein L6Q21_04865 [Sandaracinobacter sp. RS1-74]|uniref:hypothetical protein n=1 Tax=Sandaracinobacteroides sayramensis TaxID=2913411 RepID=UPI001EDC597A|nr:hypothetical protein [Sandaracinobacteroides sayramensis]MCG2840312.1 hypothetical protein [Sandaracinobacteroides sayramensis]